MGLPLGFAQPLVLLGLLSLPVLWWLLRLIPPRPRRIEFPPTRLLFDIKPKEDTPARTPWWLTLLRLTARDAGDPRRRRSAVESAGRDLDRRDAARAPDRRRLRRRGKLGRALRTADDILARAEADNRGVALVAARRSRAATSRCSRRPRPACGSSSSSRKPHAVERTDALPAISAAAGRHARHGGDLAVRRRRSRPRLGVRRGPRARVTEGRTVSVVTGGLPTAHALAAADNAAGALT